MSTQCTEKEPTEGGSPHIAKGWQRVPKAYMTVLPVGQYLLPKEPSFSFTHRFLYPDRAREGVEMKKKK